MREWRDGMVSMMCLFSYSPTVSPKHTDTRASLLAVVAGRRVVTLCEAAAVAPRLECRAATVHLAVGDCLLIPVGMHHSVKASAGSIAFSLEVNAVTTPESAPGTGSPGANLWDVPAASQQVHSVQVYDLKNKCARPRLRRALHAPPPRVAPPPR